MSKTLFHYTSVFRAVKIISDGMIKRSTGKTPPYVWLSSNPTYEPTACQLPLRTRELVHRQCDERMRFALAGRARFVFHGCFAIPWQDLPVTSAVRYALERLAGPKGGRPEEWFALEGDVSSASLPLEIEEIGGWQQIAQDELKRRYEDLEVTSNGGRLSFRMRGQLKVQ